MSFPIPYSAGRHRHPTAVRQGRAGNGSLRSVPKPLSCHQLCKHLSLLQSLVPRLPPYSRSAAFPKARSAPLRAATARARGCSWECREYRTDLSIRLSDRARLCYEVIVLPLVTHAPRRAFPDVLLTLVEACQWSVAAHVRSHDVGLDAIVDGRTERRELGDMSHWSGLNISTSAVFSMKGHALGFYTLHAFVGCHLPRHV